MGVCTYVSDMGVSNAQIAFWTSLIMLPWTLKPLWEPVFGNVQNKEIFCRHYPNGDGSSFRSSGFYLYHYPIFSVMQ